MRGIPIPHEPCDEPPLTLTEIYETTGYAPDSWHVVRDYAEKEFVAWDGEGITYEGDVAQSYVLFGNSAGMRVISKSLSTVECFELLLEAKHAFPNAIHVGFALQYDWNMMFRDLERRHLYVLYKRNKVSWNGYKIEYRPGKWTTISRGGTSVRLFDVFGFFQQSFVKALQAFLGDTSELARVIEGKQQRSVFQYEELHSMIVPYWKAELVFMVKLMDALRNDLQSAGIRLKSWHGPGAVANVVFRSKKIQDVKYETPKEVNRAAQYAYAGGRFELFKCGHYPAKVYEYDINSAYPSAIATLPNLANGQWERTTAFEPDSFGCWHVSFADSTQDRFRKPHPLFCRDSQGHVRFQDLVVGWYWTPEARLVPEGMVKGGYVFRPNDPDEQPFGFVREMYETRRQWKKDGNSAEKAYKLALNSLYGKMAQRVGWTESGKIPQWHQLEWAGYVTSYTRAKLWEAIQQAADSVISVETDAVFTTQPLDLPVGEQLGQWSCDEFDWITYVQNGVYWAGKDGKVLDKYRGYDKGSLNHDDVMACLRDGRNPVGMTTRFVGMGLALNTRAVWRSWETTERALEIGGGGKRQHVRSLCRECAAGVSLADGLHGLVCTSSLGRSEPHSLPWLAGSEAELRALDEQERW